MAGKFELYKSANEQFRFRLKAGNGELILSGEDYSSKTGAENGNNRLKQMLRMTLGMSARKRVTVNRILS